jgi:transposase
MMKTLLETQYCTLLTLDEKIGVCDIQLSAIAEQQPTCKQLMTIPGVGVISAVALYATIGKGDGFKNGRHLSAFLGLVPRQHSSGNKERLLGISKRGDEFVRRMLVHGARSVVLWASKKEDKKSQWINSLKARRGLNKTCVAVANKNARTVMSMLQSGEIYRKAA